MKTIFLALVFALLLTTACKEQKPLVPALNIDLPASYKTDTVAYNFINKQVVAWNAYGKQLESMYHKAEKFRKKDYNKLSNKEEYDLVKLDYDYVLLWGAIDMYINVMLGELNERMPKASQQGMGKLKEAQQLIALYYFNLAQKYGKDLALDKEPYQLTPEEEARVYAKLDSAGLRGLDSLKAAKDTFSVDKVLKDSLQYK